MAEHTTRSGAAQPGTPLREGRSAGPSGGSPGEGRSVADRDGHKPGSARQAVPPPAQSCHDLADVAPLLESLIVSIEEGFIVLDSELRYRAWNPFMERITGLAAADVLRRRAVDVFPGLRGHAIQSLLQRALAGEAVTSPDTPFRVPQTGREGWLVIRYLPWRDGAGNLQGAVGLVRDITGRKASEEALIRSEWELSLHNRIADVFLTYPDDDMFERVLAILLDELESAHGMFGYLDGDGSLVVPSLTEVFGQCRVQDRTVVFPRDRWGGAWGRSLVEARSVLLNESGNVPEGHIPIHRALCAPITDRGELIGLLAVANRDRDYTPSDRDLLEHIASHVGPILHARLDRDRQERERTRVEEDLRWALAEKELLLKEVHHRVKNNMAVVSSMLRLQSESLGDERVQATFETMRQRIKTMALVHEQLYSTGEFTTINLREYLEMVLRTMSQSQLGRRVSADLRVTCGDLRVDIDSAIPCGLIVTELVGNALRHAFPGDRRGTVSVDVAESPDGFFELTVRDDGVGVADRSDSTPRGFGLEMVGLLARQIGGVLETSHDGGTEVLLRFPKPRT